MAEIKKLKWKNNRSYKNEIALCYYDIIFNITIYIQNWKVSTCDSKGFTIPKFDGKFYVNKSTKDYGFTRKIKCNSLEEAKEIAQGLFNKMVAENFFEEPINRKVLTEKSKYKNRKPKKKKPVVRLVNTTMIHPDDYIGVGRTWKAENQFTVGWQNC